MGSVKFLWLRKGFMELESFLPWIHGSIVQGVLGNKGSDLPSERSVRVIFQGEELLRMAASDSKSELFYPITPRINRSEAIMMAVWAATMW